MDLFRLMPGVFGIRSGTSEQISFGFIRYESYFGPVSRTPFGPTKTNFPEAIFLDFPYPEYMRLKLQRMRFTCFFIGRVVVS